MLNEFENCHFVEYTSAAEMDRQLANKMQDTIKASIHSRGRAAIALSGGGTPLNMYRLLGSSELPWEKVLFVPTDERWVDSDHDDSNERNLKAALGSQAAEGVNFLSLKNEAADPGAGCEGIHDRLQEVDGDFDSVLLGMGADGHTASLFPGAAELEQALSTKVLDCSAMTPATTNNQRMSLTLSRLLRTRSIEIMFRGEDKLATFKQALEQKDALALPIYAVIESADSDINIHWCP